MFSIDNLLELFGQLGRVAGDHKQHLHSAAELLCEKYLAYLSEKEEKPELKARSFKYMLKNFIGQQNFKSEVIKLILADLDGEGERHLALLENDEINLVEALQERWKDSRTQVLASFNHVPQTIRTGFNNVTDYKLADQQPKSQASTVVVPDTLIQELFDSDTNKIKNALTYLLSATVADFVDPLYSRNGLELLSGFIKSTRANDKNLVELAIKILARFGPYFFGNYVYINDKELVIALFERLATHDSDSILKVLTLCSATCFTQDNVNTLRDILIIDGISISERYSAVLSIINLLQAAQHDMTHCIDPLLELCTIRDPKKLTKPDRLKLNLMQLNIGNFLITSVAVIKHYLQQPPYPTKLIKLACTPDAYSASDGIMRFSFLHALAETLQFNVASENIFQEDALRLLVDFLLFNAQDRHLTVIIKVIGKLNDDSRLPAILYDTGATAYLLNLLKSQQLRLLTFLAITYILMMTSSSHPETLSLCIENDIYLQILSFWVNNKPIQDVGQEKSLFGVLAAFFSIAPNRCIDSANVDFVLENMPHMPPEAKEHLLKFLSLALQENSPERQIQILRHISILLKETVNNINPFIEWHGYQIIKTLVDNQNLQVVSASLMVLSQLIIHPEVKQDLIFNSPYIIDKIKYLSTDSEDKEVRDNADLIFNKLGLDDGYALLKNKQPGHALIVFKKILTRYKSEEEVPDKALEGVDEARRQLDLAKQRFFQDANGKPQTTNDPQVEKKSTTSSY